MGYDQLDASQTRYNVQGHFYDADSKTHVLLDEQPVMHDSKTLKSGPALAAKGLKAEMGEDERMIFVDRQVIQVRGPDGTRNYLTNLGIEAREQPAQEAPAETASPDETTQKE